MVKVGELRERLDGHHEWLLVRELGRTFPLYSSEIEIVDDGQKTHFGFLDDSGFHSWRLNGFTVDEREITIDVAGAFARRRESMRLVPRTAAAELAAEVELARRKKANEIADLIVAAFPGTRLGRVALNTENGRLSQIIFDTPEKKPAAAIADVTGLMTPESIFAAAMIWLEELSLRKNKPVGDLWIVTEKRRARAAQKLHALLTDGWRARLTIVEWDAVGDPPRLINLAKRKLADLWREKAPRLVLPAESAPGLAADRIIKTAPEQIDVVFSRQGQTLRFMGLGFARIRATVGREKAWFGTGTQKRILSDENWQDLEALIRLLEINRSAAAPNKHHEYYRAAPEAWLESILRRNIKLLDANLILSPIYNQFRSSNDKIDLLALRRDGRLVIIELKTQPDRAGVLQAADYWRKIELQRRRGVLAAADLFDGREILDKPALVYLAAPAWSFHRDFDLFARSISPEIELWRFELHTKWRTAVKVVGRLSYRK